MPHLWTCLLYIVTIHQSAVSAEKEVFLKCNSAVTCVSTKVNCTITLLSGCLGMGFGWTETSSGVSVCNDSVQTHDVFFCNWDNKSYVSLHIQSVTKDENYTIVVQTSCDISTETVEVKPNCGPLPVVQTPPLNYQALLPGILVFIAVLAITAVVGRKMMNRRRQRIQSDAIRDSEPLKTP